MPTAVARIAPAPVAINARAAIRSELGGVERYAQELARRLPALGPGRYRVIAPRPRLAHAAGHAWEQLVLPRAAAAQRLIYSPANLAPLATGGRNVVVIHDVAALLPGSNRAYSKPYQTYQAAILPLLARWAAHVITVSEFSKCEIAEHLEVPAECISVIPGGVDPQRFNPQAPPVPGFTKPYVLVVGTASRRKNHAILAQAAHALRDQGAELVIAGGRRRYLNARAEIPGARRLGYVGEDILPGLYANATALAMPSTHEGFGLPCIEAMACGTPVVAANAAALPDTCQEAAILIDPQDADGFAAALKELTSDPHGKQAEDLRRKGSARASEFTWTRTAQATDTLLTTLADGAESSR